MECIPSESEAIVKIIIIIKITKKIREMLKLGH